MSLPARGDELAAELRRLDRPLFVFDKCRNPEARGQVIGEDQLDELVDRLGDDVATADRLLYLSWKGSDEPWLLIEDRETTESERAEMAVQRGEAVTVARPPIDLRQKIKDILTHVEPLPREAATPLRHYRRSGMETWNANKPIACGSPAAPGEKWTMT